MSITFKHRQRDKDQLFLLKFKFEQMFRLTSFFPLFIAFSLIIACQNSKSTADVDTQNATTAEKASTPKASTKAIPSSDTLALAQLEKKKDTVLTTSTTKTPEDKKEATQPTKSTTEKKTETSTEKPKKVRKRSKIKFNETTYNFGTIKTGDKVNHKFEFKNIGNAPLVIKNVDVSCGCTFPSYPFLPIKPGDKGEIDVTFDSKNKVGRQKPTITIVTNGRPRTLKLYMEGFVE